MHDLVHPSAAIVNRFSIKEVLSSFSLRLNNFDKNHDEFDSASIVFKIHSVLLAIEETLNFSIPHFGLIDAVDMPAKAHSLVSSFWQKMGPPGKNQILNVNLMTMSKKWILKLYATTDSMHCITYLGIPSPLSSSLFLVDRSQSIGVKLWIRFGLRLWMEKNGRNLDSVGALRFLSIHL